jgi:general secretion pathway protein K
MRRVYQRGVAVVTALLLTTLAITIVASLFWQQQVQVRSIENQRFQLQKKWILRGVLDWVSLILREDAKTGTIDHLGEPWAVSLGETRLDQYVEDGKGDSDASEAVLLGQISDAQAKFNLTNLATSGVVNPRAVKVFGNLLTNLRYDAGLSEQVALQVALTQDKVPTQTQGKSGESGANTAGTEPKPNPNSGAASSANTTNSPGIGLGNVSGLINSEVQFLRLSQVDDLLTVPGFTPEMIVRLRKFVTVLPVSTRVNVNTTNAEVLSAVLGNVSLTDAALMIATRDRAYFMDIEKFKLNFPDKVSDQAKDDIDVRTSYFVINGKVKMNRSSSEVNALIERNGVRTQVLWVKEN